MKTRFFVFAICLLGSLSFAFETNAQNLLQNGNFDQINAQGPVSTFTKTVRNIGGGQSGAAFWTTWTNTMGGTIETEWLPSNFMGNGMIRVNADRKSSGIVNTFLRRPEGPEEATACVWIFLVRGEVSVGIGDGGNTHTSMTLTERGKWERITVSNGVAPANQLIIYTNSKGGAEFFVESASVVPGPPWETECCYPE